MLTSLLCESSLAAFEDLPALVADHADRAGLGRTRIFVADLQQVVLREVTGRGQDAQEGGQELLVDGTLPGRAYQTQEAQRSRTGQYWLPMLDGIELIGVLGIEPRAPVGNQEDAELRALASLVGMLLVSKRTHSDSFARLTRVREMNVAAEMQWTLMLPRCFASERVDISAVMEPAYQLGGDAFDYAVSGDIIHLSVFDAIGHDVSAGLIANLAVATCRNIRRQGGGIVEASEAIEALLADCFDQSRFATGILAELDLRTGMLTWSNFGHPQPVILRGGRWINSLHCQPSHPLGAELGVPVSISRDRLEPGDRLLLYTDGITEARNTDGEEFGLERFVDLFVRKFGNNLPPAENLRRLIHAILDQHGGRLKDDATVLVCEWRARQ
jgi:serine phosphatase RsbU (regulator of sigma subunit)